MLLNDYAKLDCMLFRLNYLQVTADKITKKFLIPSHRTLILKGFKVDQIFFEKAALNSCNIYMFVT